MRATPPPAAAARPAPAAPPAVTVPRVASLAELPAELRSGLPALAFGGSIYSNTPANRLLIVNGQLMHEGESLGPGVVLEQIKPKAAVLNIRGQRYEVAL
jgi:general secretion pathway protein B